jgi:hypothetical protein
MDLSFVKPQRTPDPDEDETPGMLASLVQPTRWPIVIGLALVSVCSFLPWETIRYDNGTTLVHSGIDESSAVGFQLILAGAVTLVASATGWVTQSRDRLVQLAPALFGAATFLLCLGKYRLLATDLSAWDSIELGFWLSLIGSAAVGAGGGLVSLLIARQRQVQHYYPPVSVGHRLLIPVAAAAAGLVLSLTLVTWQTNSLNDAGYTLAAPWLIVTGTFVFGCFFDGLAEWAYGRLTGR